ncbi:hypothetical protein QOT17_005087 [Balamuthia mandrillaris]
MFKGKGKSVATYASVEDTAPFADHDKAEDDGMVDEETLSSSSPPSSRKGGDSEEADEDEYILVDPTKQQTATATSCTFNLVNNIIGGGVLALPFALKTSGIFLGSFLLCLVGALSAYSCQLLISASSRVETKSYRAIAAACYGRKGAIMLDLSMVLFIFGALTGYMIIVGDVLTPFTGFLGPLDTRAFVVAVAMLTVMLPLSLLTKVDKLKYTSILALACILYLVGVVSFHGVKHVWDKSVKESLEDLHLMRFTVGVFTSIPIICFSFTFHPNIFPIFGEMKNATRRRMQRVVFSSSAFCGIVYVVVGVLGYITFAEETEGNIFTNYNDNTAVEVGKILLAVIIWFGFFYWIFFFSLSFFVVYPVLYSLISGSAIVFPIHCCITPHASTWTNSWWRSLVRLACRTSGGVTSSSPSSMPSCPTASAS